MVGGRKYIIQTGKGCFKWWFATDTHIWAQDRGIKAFEWYDMDKFQKTLTQNHKTHVHIPYICWHIFFRQLLHRLFSTFQKYIHIHTDTYTDINTHDVHNTSQIIDPVLSFSVVYKTHLAIWIWKLLLQFRTISPHSSLSYVSNHIMTISCMLSCYAKPNVFHAKPCLLTVQLSSTSSSSFHL